MLNLIVGYFDQKFKAMQNQIDKKYWEPPRKRAIHNDYYFKSKGNSLQLKFKSVSSSLLVQILARQNRAAFQR